MKTITRSIALAGLCVAAAQAAVAAPCENITANQIGNNNQLIVVCVPAATQSYPAPSLWGHNGSVMRLAGRGATRQFFYEVPRAGLKAEGAAQGTLLFTGIRQGATYNGTAFIFHSGCAPAPYEVSGRVDDDDRGVTLFGSAPVLDKAGNVVSTRPDILTFSFLGS